MLLILSTWFLLFACDLLPLQLVFPLWMDFSALESQVFLFLQLKLRLCIRQPSCLGNGLLGQWRKTLRSRFLLLELSVIQVPRDCRSMEIKSTDWIILPLLSLPPFLKCICGLVILSFLSLLVTVLCKTQDKNIKFHTPAGNWIPNMSSPDCSNLFYFVHCIVKKNIYVAFAINVAKKIDIFFPAQNKDGYLFQIPVILSWDSLKIIIRRKSGQQLRAQKENYATGNNV